MTATAMRISKPNTCLTHTSTLIKFVFVINFFTLSAWLLHPSQVTKLSCDLNNFFSITSRISTLSLTMALTKNTLVQFTQKQKQNKQIDQPTYTFNRSTYNKNALQYRRSDQKIYRFTRNSIVRKYKKK